MWKITWKLSHDTNVNERFKIFIMSSEGMTSKFLLRILLIYMCVVDSQRLPDTYDFNIEFSYTDEQQDHIRQKRDVNTGLLEYIVLVEINVSQAILIEQIKTSVDSIRLPFQVDNTTAITSFNITTVCLPNDTKYQCICEDQYVWPYDYCTAYEACDEITLGTCGCINAIPSDGGICEPKSEIPFYDFLVEIEMNATNIVKEEVKTLLGGIRFPVSLDGITEVTEVDITTVCLFNYTGYQCRCENQYFWPCDQCTTYQHCDDIISDTCGCLDAIPNDGQFCQPMTELSNISCPTSAPPTAISTATTTLTASTQMTTTTIATSTATTIPTASTQMTTTTIAPTTATTSSATQTTTTGLVIRTSSQATTTTTTTTTSTTTSTKSTASPYIISLSLTINEQFDTSYYPDGTNYASKKTILEDSINSIYKSLTSYVPNSVMVTRFRSGSVIVDYNIAATNANPNLELPNNQLVTSLSEKGIPITANGFTKRVPTGIYVNSSTVYPQQNVKLWCNISSINAGSITWYKDTKDVNNNNKYFINATEFTLTVINVTSADSGVYSCKIVAPIPYVALTTITVYPNANLQTSSNKTVGCTDASDTTLILMCCANHNYNITMDVRACSACTNPGVSSDCKTYQYMKKKGCLDNTKVQWVTCQATGNEYNEYKTIKINASNEEFACSSSDYGGGHLNQNATVDCTGEMVGNQIIVCQSAGWNITQNNCIPRVIQNLIDRAQNLAVSDIPEITANLSSATLANRQNITGSQVTILGIVELLQQIANVSQNLAEITELIMKDFLQTVGVITSIEAQKTWTTLNNNNETQKTSSLLLMSIEEMAQKLSNRTFEIVNSTIHLTRTNISVPYLHHFGQNVIDILDLPGNTEDIFFTFIFLSNFSTVLPVRNAAHTSINGDVVVIRPEKIINNINISFSLINNSLKYPQCVFWNFALLQGIGGWDPTGCESKVVENETVKCECNHTTSFSILMSPFASNSSDLAYITYIGVGISMVSLVLCLIIEIIIWKAMTRNDTSYMRHVSIVNIALSLLIADICFIIGASIVNPERETPVGPCSAVTFFIHFFYLVLFFWMLLSALLLLYRTVMVFSGLSRVKMMAIAFTIGYGAPLLIAVITVASTAGNKGYVAKKDACWLNWDQTKALLAFVIPALTIVVINLLVLIVVIYKMLRRGVGSSSQPDEKHILVVIARCVGILTPIFGLTWGIGIGTMVSPNKGIHVVFATLNSLQGFFILVFGTLLDSKVREVLARRLSLINISSNRTRSTTAGLSSSSGHPIIQRLR
ncbi:uncharacterized protein LOC143523178 isoform X2 [Brachyhypopomus gauderio]|uniref:uncharacterized protein LOC143523178 isoform X2 n=1 Tax=Brachyhypopomus gauderio TaxID=698409 RepID=UPI0040420177